MEKTDDSNALKRYFSFKKDWLTGRVRCFDVSGKELAAQFNFHERAWKEYLNECLEAESLPFIFVSIQPQFMPSELKEIPDSTNIVLRDEAAAYDMLTTAERARKKIAAAIKRRNLGVINVSEAAFLLARQDGAHIKTYRKLIEDAFIKTDIDFIENKLPRLTIDATARMAWLNANGMKHPGYIINDEWAFTTPKNINNWLDKIDKEGFMPRIQSSSPTPEPQAAPVEAETVEQRRARWLAMFEAEEKRGKRGALQRVADREGFDRSNMSKDIKKAQAARDEKKRAGGWGSQLVQDGKRKS